MKRWIARQFRTFLRIHAWWRDQLTIVGKVISLIMICALPTLADLDSVWAIVFISSTTLLLFTSSVSFLYRPRLAVRATGPEHWMRSETRVLPVEITNRGRRPAYALRIELVPEAGIWDIAQPACSVPALYPGESITVRNTVRALRRGEYPLPRLRATTLFPLELVRRGTTYPLRRSALILPFYRPLRSLELVRSVPNLARGTTLAFQNIGLNGEYVGSREYQPGVPVRKWDYPSWARLGQPVVREYCDPQHPTVAVILDTFHTASAPDANQPNPAIEAILSLAAAMTESLLTRGNGIEMLVVGKHTFFLHHSTWYEGHQIILEHLALAQPGRVEDLAPTIGAIEQLPLTWDFVIVVSHHWGSRQEQLFQAATRQRTPGSRIVVSQSVQPNGRQHQRRLLQFTCADVEAGMVDL